MWESVLDFYIGQCGINPDMFWKNTFNENTRLAESFQIKENLEWERLRYISAMLINVNASKSSQRIQPTKLFKLPQDKKDKTTISKPLTKEELDKVIKGWDKTMRDGKKSKM